MKRLLPWASTSAAIAALAISLYAARRNGHHDERPRWPNYVTCDPSDSPTERCPAAIGNRLVWGIQCDLVTNSCSWKEITVCAEGFTGWSGVTLVDDCPRCMELAWMKAKIASMRPAQGCPPEEAHERR